MNTAKSISQQKNIPVEKVTAIDIMKNYFELSAAFSESISTAFDKYVDYSVNSYNMSRREQEDLLKEVTTNLASFLTTLKGFLDSCGALDHARIHHNTKMSQMNLSKLAVTPEQIDKEFDFAKNSRLPLPEIATKAAFWANKAAKYIEHLKISILLFEGSNLSYTKGNYKKFSDKEKITAILKEQILTKLKNDISSQLPEDYSFSALLILYSSIIDYQQTQDESRLDGIIDKLPLLEEDNAHSLIKQMHEFHNEYDDIFDKNNNSSAFSKEAYSISNNFVLEEELYNYKTTLMFLLGSQLIEQKSLPVPYIKHFGNSYDKKLDNNVLTVDLPNYFMPASFHYDKSIAGLPEFEKFISRMPEYKGFFVNSNPKNSISTSILFAPTAEQRKYIKDEFKKAKSHPDSYRTKVLSQMNGMANDKWQDFDNLIDKGKTK